MAPEKPFSVLLADYLRAALIDYNNGSAEDTRNAEDACGRVLAEYARVVNDLSEDLHSAARCGQQGPHACPGCVIDGLREELAFARAEKETMRRGYEVNQVGLLAKLAEVRTGKSRVYDGIDRRGWTREQWLEEARSIFYHALGGAGDLLNGHISAMWEQLITAKKEQEQLVAIVTATLRQLGTVLGVNIGEEIRKHGKERELAIPTAHMQEAPEPHGWTWHGHRCCDQANEQKPGWIPGIWKCGGSPQCPVCKTEVERMAGHREERGPHV